jgi:RNA polymerase sigma factor (sigma-70 family)
LNHHRGLWRRFLRELESKQWFERPEEPAKSPKEEPLMVALRDLPPAQREVIVLKIWHRHTFEEIADLLEESPNTVAGRYRYGLQKLRKHLTSLDYEGLETDRESIAFVETPATLTTGG